MFNNHHSLHKQKCRDLIEKQVSKYKGEVKVFTLPSTNFILEEKLLSNPNVKLYCAENNASVYKQQKKNVLSKQITLKKGDAFEVLDKSKQNYNVVWMDLCCPLRKPVINRVLSLVQSDKLDDCYFNLTVACSREQNYEDNLKFYGANTLKEFRNTVFPKLVQSFAENSGKKCKLVSTINYKEKGYSVPMKMLTFKIK